MRTIGLIVSAVLLAVAAVVVILNWTPRTYTVTGVITREGKPLKWKSKNHVLQIIFVPKNRTRQSGVYRCEGDADGRYVLPEIPADTYRVSISQWDPYPKHDLLQGAYWLAKSPLFYEVSGDCEIDIDLPKDLP
jgi:hypothetical protein